MLKKEFKRKDVNRARNLITGNIDSSTGIQVGYNKKTKNYKEGDIWEEKGKKWTKQDPYRIFAYYIKNMTDNKLLVKSK